MTSSVRSSPRKSNNPYAKSKEDINDKGFEDFNKKMTESNSASKEVPSVDKKLSGKRTLALISGGEKETTTKKKGKAKSNNNGQITNFFMK